MSNIKIRDENFYTVLGWMLNVLKLKGNNLIVFAIIYSFSQDGESEFTGSLTYLQSFANIKSQQTVITVLNTLIEMNLIKKSEYMKGNVRRIAYRANLEYIDNCKGNVLDIKPSNK
ncbi:MAG: hypothetical protein HFK07_02085 [Clostridia bacterium]|jgi:hypothetical protein|nr:hypothetical protein [Clostridia bacterium]